MECNAEGFLRPVIDDSLCISCHACEKACHKMVELLPPRKNIHQCFSIASTDEAVRTESSSGGLVSELAAHFLREGGVVFGVVMQDRDTPIFREITEESDLAGMRGSKYLQARPYSCFKKIRTRLQHNQSVLFIGLPCQVRSLRAYIGYHKTLVTVDLACYGVPSRKLYDSWLMSLEQKQQSPVEHVLFRDKTQGWRSYRMKIRYQNGFEEVLKHNLFHTIFLSGIALNDSCYYCVKDVCTHYSDITIGDFWGARELSDEENSLGVSCVAVHTETGRTLLQAVKERTVQKSIHAADCYRHNEGMKSVGRDVPWQRNEFLHRLKKEPLEQLFEEFFVPKGRMRVSFSLGSKHFLFPTWADYLVFPAVRVARRLRKITRCAGQRIQDFMAR